MFKYQEHPKSNMKNTQSMLQPQQLPPPTDQVPMNEDLDFAQLYGQISMFDQLTDYADVENEDQQQYSPQRLAERDFDDEHGDDDCHGEGDSSSADLREYRHRICNEDLDSQADAGEDEECLVSDQKVHNLQVNTQEDNGN